MCIHKKKVLNVKKKKKVLRKNKQNIYKQLKKGG